MTMSLHQQAWAEQGTDDEERPPPISMGILAVLVLLSALSSAGLLLYMLSGTYR